jgi:subtilisin-like proprotein convertase family protein
MKKFTFFLIAASFFIFSLSDIFSQNITDEYGYQNSNRYLGGLGIAASYAYLTSSPAFNQNTNGSLEMWIMPASFTGNDKTLISKGATTNVSFLWCLTSGTGQMYFRIGTTIFSNTGGTAPALNQWSHVAVTWSGGPNFTVKFYLNGIQTGNAVSLSATWYTNSDEIRIGGSEAYPGNAFIGNIDEVRYWSVELPSSKIINNRFIGIGDIQGSNSTGQLTTNSYYTGLIASWTFNRTDIVNDEIGGHNGNYTGSAASMPQTSSVPLPYNFTLKFGSTNIDYMTVSHHSAFNQTTDGTIDLWYYPTSFNTEQILLSKGASAVTTTMILGVTASTGKLYFGTGSSIALNTTGSGLTLNQWNHIAVTWSTSGSNFIVNFYKNGYLNGSPSTIARPMPTNTDNFYIGSSQVYNLPAKGFIDELRIWNPALPQEEIRKYIFVSCRSFTANIVAAWNFDGSLNNFSSYGGALNASFNSGSTNNCRFSGYLNDDTPGQFSSAYISHTTVINRTGSPNPFPPGFNLSNPFVAIPDNNSSGVSDSIIIPDYPGTLNSIEVFLSVAHTWVGDLVITLKAPNGQTRTLTSRNGGSADNILSFFNDNFTYTPSSNEYIPPWGFLKPTTPFNQFGGSTIQGTWIIKCTDNASSDVGVLRGWGIRFNNLVNVEPVSGNIPGKFILYQNYPNPFNPVTNIKFDIPKDEYVAITIFDMLGRETSNLINEFKKAGSYSVRFDGANLSSGTYFYRINAGSFVDTKKMVLIK